MPRAAAAAGLAILLALSACAPGADLSPLPDQPATGYKLGAGDQIRVITFGADQLSGQFRIDSQGDIDMPLVGSVHASGESPEALAAILSTDLKDKKLLRFTYRAFEKYASAVRSTSGTAVEGIITPRSFLAPGDVVKIYERHF
jgi:polysaccharide export outer membrane protein